MYTELFGVVAFYSTLILGEFWSARLKAQIAYWNKSRRRAEFRRAARTVKVMNRISRMASQSSIDLDDNSADDDDQDHNSDALKSSTSSSTVVLEARHNDTIRSASLQEDKALSDSGCDGSSSNNNIDNRVMVDKFTTRSLPHMNSVKK